MVVKIICHEEKKGNNNEVYCIAEKKTNARIIVVSSPKANSIKIRNDTLKTLDLNSMDTIGFLTDKYKGFVFVADVDSETEKMFARELGLFEKKEKRGLPEKKNRVKNSVV